jgi:hypothetical protein
LRKAQEVDGEEGISISVDIFMRSGVNSETKVCWAILSSHFYKVCAVVFRARMPTYSSNETSLIVKIYASVYA